MSHKILNQVVHNLESSVDNVYLKKKSLENRRLLAHDNLFSLADYCSSSIVLSKKRKDPTTALPVVESHDPERKTGLRSVNTCSCKICSVANLNGLDFLLASRKNKRKLGRATTKMIPKNVKICENSFTKLYRGCSHSTSQ